LFVKEWKSEKTDTVVVDDDRLLNKDCS